MCFSSSRRRRGRGLSDPGDDVQERVGPLCLKPRSDPARESVQLHQEKNQVNADEESFGQKARAV
jgi:hypothetical protein